jgi:hypothetical protein
MGHENGTYTKVAVHRLRGRFSELSLEQVAQTMATESEVEEELRHMLNQF